MASSGSSFTSRIKMIKTTITTTNETTTIETTTTTKKSSTSRNLQMERTTTKTWNPQIPSEESSPSSNTSAAEHPKVPTIKTSNGKSTKTIAGDIVKRTITTRIIVKERIGLKERRVTRWGRRETTSIRGTSLNIQLRTRPHLSTTQNTPHNHPKRNTSKNNKTNPRPNLMSPQPTPNQKPKYLKSNSHNKSSINNNPRLSKRPMLRKVREALRRRQRRKTRRKMSCSRTITTRSVCLMAFDW